MIVINFWPPCQGRQVSVCVVDGECFEFVFVLVPVLENAASQIIRPHVSNITLVFFFMVVPLCWWKWNTRWLLDFNSPHILYPDSLNNSAAADPNGTDVWLRSRPRKIRVAPTTKNKCTRFISNQTFMK